MNLPHLHLPTRAHSMVFVGIIIFTVVLAGFTEYRYQDLRNEIHQRDQLISESTLSTEKKIADMSDIIVRLSMESDSLKDVFLTEQNKNNSVNEQIGRVADTVGALDRLSKTDPQLLQKYSKIYFLNEHYSPSALAAIPSEYLYNKESQFQIHEKVLPYLEKMLQAAKADGVDIQVISAYRSYNTQAALKSSYKVTYGAGTANQFSADQGYSEHQLGSTLDFTTPSVGATFSGFDKTPAYTWLTNNAQTYGFTLSYPPNNKYYMYEPWHWRFVGIDLANRLKRDGKFFYDLEQRDIDNYLLLLFN